MATLFCVLLSCVGRGLAIGLRPHPRRKFVKIWQKNSAERPRLTVGYSAFVLVVVDLTILNI
jgi:hypothetical protein